MPVRARLTTPHKIPCVASVWMLCSGMKLKAQAPRAITDEYRTAEFGDERLRKRLLKVVGAVSRRPSDSFPAVMGSKSDLAGSYRFMNNPSVTADQILAPHIEETRSRAEGFPELLAIQDTTEVEPRGGGRGEDLGELRPGKPGFFFHASLLVVPDEHRTPLGVVGAQRWTRAGLPRVKGRKNRLSGPAYGKIPPEEKESYRWWKGVEEAEEAVGEACSLIHVADREGDMYWFLARLAESNRRFVVRGAQNRKVVGESDQEKLIETLAAQPSVLEYEIDVSRRKASSAPRSRKIHGDRQARTSVVCVSAACVELKRAQATKLGPPSLEVNVVRVWEPVEPEDKSKRVDWLLLTSEPIKTPEDLKRIVDCYRTRWVIEEFFKALKTGCALESRQFDTYHALQNVLAVLIPLAWRLLLLRSLERQAPEIPADNAVRTSLVDVLRVFSSHKLSDDPTVQDVFLAIAALGGHLKNNGPPGWLILGRGYEQLLTLEMGWLAAKQALGKG